MSFALWLTPLIGALIGWFTNYLAVKMIFRPQHPITVPILDISFQGLIPKRKGEIAQSLGEIIERELVSIDELANHLWSKDTEAQLINLLAAQANEAVLNSLPPLIPEPVKVVAGNLVESMVRRQGPNMFEQFATQALDEIKNNLSLAELIEDKINEMEWDVLEKLVLEIASRELKHIEVLGAVIGFLIGLTQLILAWFF